MESTEKRMNITPNLFGFSICPVCHDSLPYNGRVEATRKCKYRKCGTGYFVVPTEHKNWMSVEEYNEKQFWQEGPMFQAQLVTKDLNKIKLERITDNLIECLNSGVLKQKQVAEILEISQPAVSKRLKNLDKK